MKFEKEYLEMHGVNCPFCFSENTGENVALSDEGDEAWREDICYECNKKWLVKFSVSAIFEKRDA